MLGKNSQTYKNWKKEWEKYKIIPNDLDIINLGSTMSVHDFNYSYWNLCGFNMASAPRDMYYDLQVLEQYGNHLREGGVVIICMAEFALLTDKYEQDDHNYKYYGYLDSQRILNYTSQKAQLIKKYPGLLDIRLIKQEIKDSAKKLLLKNSDKLTDVAKESQRYMDSWMEEFGWQDGYNITDNQRVRINNSLKILEEMIKYCNDQRLISVIVVPPFPNTLKKLMPEKLLQECLWDYLDKLVIKGVKVINFWDDKELSDEKFYSNPICLNSKGQEIFNRKLQTLIYGDDNRTMEIQSGEENTSYYVLNNGLHIPQIAFGTGVVKRFYRNKALYFKDVVIAILRSARHRKMVRFFKNDQIVKKILDYAIRSGYKLFDSGRLYGHSEKYIGEVTSKYKREDLFLITKISDVDLKRYANAPTVHENLSLSLRFLKTDYVDAYLLHFPSGDWISMYKEIEKEYKAGRAKAIGVCNFDVSELKLLMSQCSIKPMICQVELNPLNTKKDLQAYCNENGIIIMAHSPTAHMDKRVVDSDVMKELVSKYNKSAAQIMYRWHYQNSIIPIVSSISENHLKENIDIFDFALSSEEMGKIDTLNQNYSFDKNNNKINDCPEFIYNL